MPPVKSPRTARCDGAIRAATSAIAASCVADGVALADDPATRVIVLISKPPAPAIARKILDLAAAAGKPVVVHFLGAAPDGTRGSGLVAAESLQHAGDVAVALAAGHPAPTAGATPSAAQLAAIGNIADRMAPSQRAVRGLFTGGTFCYEAQLVFRGRGLPCRSNAPVEGVLALGGRPEGHVFIDMGDDDYTRGRPHPMIDPSLRNAAVLKEAADPATAAIVFDVVLGYGSHADPAAGLAEAIMAGQRDARAQGRTLALIGHVCGTDGDPQDRAAQIRQLEVAGAIVAGSNFEAATLAAALAVRLARRGV